MPPPNPALNAVLLISELSKIQTRPPSLWTAAPAPNEKSSCPSPPTVLPVKVECRIHALAFCTNRPPPKVSGRPWQHPLTTSLLDTMDRRRISTPAVTATPPPLLIASPEFKVELSISNRPERL